MTQKKQDKRNDSGLLRSYLRWPLYMGVFLTLCAGSLYFFNYTAAIICSVCVLIYDAVAVAMYFRKSKEVIRALTKYCVNYDTVQNRLLKEMNIPFAVLDSEGGVIWGNKEFLEVINYDKSAKKNIANVIPEISYEKFPRGGLDEILHVVFNDINYRVQIRGIDTADLFGDVDMLWDEQEREKNAFVALYLYDETDIMRVIKENDEQKTVVGLLYIDNYEEALDSVDEIKRSLLIALVERKITKYFQNIDAIVKKLEKDKYIVVFKNKYFKQLKENKFSLLEDIKTISVGNEISITLSFGIGADAEKLIANYDNARAAIDLALARGGDQVVIKNLEKVTYYGGKSVQVEKSTRVKARVKAHALKEILETKEVVFVMGHSISDVDCFGSAVGIYRISKVLGKKAYIVIDDVNTSLRPIVERVKTDTEYAEGALITSSQALEMDVSNAALVVVDVNRPTYTQCPALLDKIKTVIVLDHHRQAKDAIDKAVLSYVEPFASSACEMVAEILQYIDDKLKLKPQEADAMYAGMVIDTDNFQSKTGVRTFEAAAYLRRSGADIIRIRKALRTDMREYRVIAQAISTTEIFASDFAITECCSKGLESPTIVGSQIANELLDVVGVKASFVVTDYNNKIYISARSIDEVNVQIIMEKLGGGGHLGMAGAQIEGKSADEVKSMIKALVSQMRQDGEI